MIIRPEGNGFIPNNHVTKIITDILASLYLMPYPTWSDFPDSLVQQMFNQFKTKCSWEDQCNRKICKNWEYKCRRRLSDSFSTARRVKKKPSWVLPHIWVDLEKYWTTDKFKKQSEQGKKARASEKGGSLHCLGSRSMGDTRRYLEKKLGRKLSHDEFFMEAHIRKKKAPTYLTRWVEDLAETTHGRYKINLEEYTQSLPLNEQGERPPISDEEEKRIWLSTVGGPKKEIAYGLSDKSFWCYRAGLQGIGTSAQGEAIDSSAISSMEEKIAKLTAELEETKAREKKNFDTLQGQLERRDKQFDLLQGQLVNLLVCGAFPIPWSPPPSPSAGDEGPRTEDEDDAT
ncbi:uncharacterized protein [Nicotiana sylvestris]|uniref:uncharacterized protein isoform X2 n=1 Tax=Nicotiana sylvestris TaxID=4096 RepID=UPI00388C457F